MEGKRKQYKLQSKTIDKINKLKVARESENPEIKVYEKDVIVEAIDYAYSAKFGKDVFDQTMTKMEVVLGNMMKSVLNEHVLKLAAALDTIHMQNEQINESLLLILTANDIMPHTQNEVLALLMRNENLDNLIHEAVLIKKEFK